MYRLLDGVIFSVLRLKDNQEGEYANRKESVEHTKHLHYEMDTIDNKNSTLLTHVSVMLAVVVGILFTQSNDTSILFSVVLQVEVVLYTVAALFLPRQ